MRRIVRKLMLGAVTMLAVRVVEYFMTDTGKPGSLSRKRS